jgi:catechol 2,3-dioxygenase-like lactoylglutathione lyase family enzyme
MARIKHIAIYTDDPDRAAKFYSQAFDLKEVRRSKTGSVIMTDGDVSLSLLKARDGVPKGLHHFGFQVESCEVARRQLEEISGETGSYRPERAVIAEFRIHDPDGVPLDVSDRPWAD